MTQATWSRILLVSDDPGNLVFLKSALDAVGHDVVGCPTVAEAVACAQREPFAVAVIDVQQPDEMGLELLGKLRHRNSQIATIVSDAVQSFLSEKEIMQGITVTYLEKSASS